MADPDEHIRFARPMLFQAPKPEWTVWLTMTEYDTIMGRVKQANPPPDYLSAAAWTCVGLVAAALLGAITFPFSVDFRTQATDKAPSVLNVAAVVMEVVLVLATIAFAVVTWALFYLVSIWRQNRLDVQAIVLEDMDAIRSRCIQSAQHTGEETG
jgi:hypothetical protein